MGIYVSYSPSHELLMLDEVESFFVTGLSERGETVPQVE